MPPIGRTASLLEILVSEGGTTAMRSRRLNLIPLMVVLAWMAAADVLAQGDPVDQSIKDLRDESWQIRWNAAGALGDTGDPRAVEPLAAALKDENSYVRATAATALGAINDPRVIDPLIGALKDESHGVRKNAALSLKKRTGQNFGQDYEAWRQWWQKNRP
jgi:HEAT repeat protein